jgi:hypothetical protein
MTNIDLVVSLSLATLAYIVLSNYINHRGILLTLQGRKSRQLKKYPITKSKCHIIRIKEDRWQAKE